MEFGEPSPIALVARVSEKLARYLRETPLSKSQTLTPSGGAFTLRATVKDTWQLHWWILGQSPEITIMEPEHLARGIKGALAAALAGYGEQQETKQQ
jgi:predicted DNA-binding transcriptional regulator YafY